MSDGCDVQQYYPSKRLQLGKAECLLLKVQHAAEILARLLSSSVQMVRSGLKPSALMQLELLSDERVRQHGLLDLIALLGAGGLMKRVQTRRPDGPAQHLLDQPGPQGHAWQLCLNGALRMEEGLQELESC